MQQSFKELYKTLNQEDLSEQKKELLKLYIKKQIL